MAAGDDWKILQAGGQYFGQVDSVEAESRACLLGVQALAQILGKRSLPGV